MTRRLGRWWPQAPHYWLDMEGRPHRCWQPAAWVSQAARHTQVAGLVVPAAVVYEWFAVVEVWSLAEGWRVSPTVAWVPVAAVAVDDRPTTQRGFRVPALRCVGAWAVRRAMWRLGRRRPLALLVAE